MADYEWEDEVEPAMEAAEWVLERLYDTFVMLDDNDKSEYDEFREAASSVRELIAELQDIRNECFNRREGMYAEDEDAEDEDADVDVSKIMGEMGLKQVDGVHYKEDAYTGSLGKHMIARKINIGNYLDGKESWEDVLKRANSDMALYPLKERSGPVPERTEGRMYSFLYYNPRVNLMTPFLILKENRKDKNGVVITIEAKWEGLGRFMFAGYVDVYIDGRPRLSKGCTHFSQVISLLEHMPTQFTIEEIEKEWCKL